MIPNVLLPITIPHQFLASANLVKLQNHIAGAGSVARMYKIIELAAPHLEFTTLKSKSGLEIRLDINDGNLEKILNLPLE